MDVGTETDVVGQIPADVVGVVVDDDVVRIPKPAITVAHIVGSDGEVETAEPEAARASSSEMPDVAATDATGEVAMLPGMVEMIVNVVASGVVADPGFAAVDVWGVGMASAIVEMPVFFRCVRSFDVRGTALGNVVVATDFGVAGGGVCFMLGDG